MCVSQNYFGTEVLNDGTQFDGTQKCFGIRVAFGTPIAFGTLKSADVVDSC